MVNGDAELTVALESKRGETRIACQGFLQEAAVREKTCEIMEGGREAFARRYRRLAQDPRHV